jgi:acetyl/propionyl-CoA carboxylase alpha subunit
VNHNVPFLRSVMENKRFNSGKLSTNFIPEEYPEGFKGHPVTPADIDELIASAAAIHLSRSRRDATISQQLHSRPFSSEYALHRTHRTRACLQSHTTHDTHRNMDLVVTVEGKNYPITLVQEPTASPPAGAPTHPAIPSLEETDECEVVIKQDDGQERRVKVNYQWQLDSPVFSAIVEYLPQPHTRDRTRTRALLTSSLSVCACRACAVVRT